MFVFLYYALPLYLLPIPIGHAVMFGRRDQHCRLEVLSLRTT